MCVRAYEWPVPGDMALYKCLYSNNNNCYNILFKDEFSLRALYRSEMIHSSPIECSHRNAMFKGRVYHYDKTSYERDVLAPWIEAVERGDVNPSSK